MDAIECIKTRMSIRKFKPDPVPVGTLMKVIDTAKWSPSYKNSQPWEIVIVSGRKKEELTNLLIGLLEQNEKPCSDLPEPEYLASCHRRKNYRAYKKEKRADRKGPERSGGQKKIKDRQLQVLWRAARYFSLSGFISASMVIV